MFKDIVMEEEDNNSNLLQYNQYYTLLQAETANYQLIAFAKFESKENNNYLKDVVDVLFEKGKIRELEYHTTDFILNQIPAKERIKKYSKRVLAILHAKFL